MKVLVTGVAGQLGHDVMNELYKRGYEGIGSDITPDYEASTDCPKAASMTYIQMDITDGIKVRRVIREVSPDVVIHCAAWTAVDAAEDANNICKVEAINIDGTKNIAAACNDIGAAMLYLSTDYVFDGHGDKPWEADCTDYKPLNVYGRTKLAGEFAVSGSLDKYFIIRISWVFGKNGNNFVKTMLDIGKKHEMIKVVNDQIGTPTYTYDLAVLIVDMIETDKYGYYHASNEGGYISWYDFACEIYREAGYTTKVVPVTTEEYGMSKAARPSNSRLSKKKLEQAGFSLLPAWKDALKRYLKEIK